VAVAYCNWLHNDKRTDAEAFLTGAYDTSIIHRNPDSGMWTLPESHLPGARFWLPTLDEWTKAMYYDPDKNGPDQEGYWRYQITSDEVPISGYPWEGGQTAAGIMGDPRIHLDVGSYPNVQSPWGLMDGSGSQWELVETSFHGFPTIKGTAEFHPDPSTFDKLDYLNGTSANVPGMGFRLASVVPSAGHLTWLLLPLRVFTYRRRSH
jgi:hypothetical protein